MTHPDQVGGAVTTLVIKRLPSGVRVVVDLADQAVCVNILHDRFERNELDFVERSIGIGDHVIDVGANIGYFALSMANWSGLPGLLWPSSHPPAPCTACAGVARMGSAMRMTVVEAAAGSRDGDARFVSDPDSTNEAADSCSRTRPECSRRPCRVAGSTRTPRRVMRRRPVAFLKLDAEGAELRSSAGADTLLREDRPVILAELDPFCLERVSGIRPRDLIAFMSKRRYVCHRLGAGTAGERIDDSYACGTEPVVFLPVR